MNRYQITSKQGVDLGTFEASGDKPAKVALRRLQERLDKLGEDLP
jgi:hypothetical protein